MIGNNFDYMWNINLYDESGNLLFECQPSGIKIERKNPDYPYCAYFNTTIPTNSKDVIVEMGVCP